MVLFLCNLIKQATLYSYIWTCQNSLEIAGNVFYIIVLGHVDVTLWRVGLAHEMHVWVPRNVFVRRHVIEHTVFDADDVGFRYINGLTLIINFFRNICELLLGVNNIKEGCRRTRFKIDWLNYSQVVFNQKLHLIQLDLVFVTFMKLISHTLVMVEQFLFSLYLKFRRDVRILLEIDVERFIFDLGEIGLNLAIKMLLKHKWFVEYRLFNS